MHNIIKRRFRGRTCVSRVCSTLLLIELNPVIRTVSIHYLIRTVRIHYLVRCICFVQSTFLLNLLLPPPLPPPPAWQPRSSCPPPHGLTLALHQRSACQKGNSSISSSRAVNCTAQLTTPCTPERTPMGSGDPSLKNRSTPCSARWIRGT